MGHAVHEGDGSLMSFCKTSGSGLPGPFFLAIRVSRTRSGPGVRARFSNLQSSTAATAQEKTA